MKKIISLEYFCNLTYATVSYFSKMKTKHFGPKILLVLLFFSLFQQGCDKTPIKKNIEVERLIKKNKYTLLFIYNVKCNGAKTYLPLFKDFDTFKNGSNILFINCGKESLNYYKNIKEINIADPTILKISVIEKYNLNNWLDTNFEFSNMQKDSAFWVWPLLILVDNRSNVIQVQPNNFVSLISMMKLHKE